MFLRQGDFQTAIRSLRRTPVSTTFAILSIALGLGANSVIFSLFDVLLLQPLAGVRQPSELLQIEGPAFPSTILDGLKDEAAFAGACGFATPLLTTEDAKGMRPVGALTMTGECFSTLGIHTSIGRLLSSGDDKPGAPKAAVISDDLWRDSFSRSASALGATIRVAGVPFTVVGVTAPEFRGLLLGFPPGVILPASQDPSSAHVTSGPRDFSWVHIFLRPAKGISRAQAQARLATLSRKLPPEFQGDRRDQYVSQKLTLVPASTGIDYSLRKRFGNPLKILLMLCGIVLLVSCINLANLLMARGAGRRRELAVRIALGARRMELLAPLVVESLLLVGVGAIAACGVAALATRLIVQNVTASLINFHLDATLNVRALCVTFAVAVFISLIAGVFPALRASEVDPAEALRKNSRSIAPAGRGTRLLIIGQVALTLALVATTEAFVSSLSHLQSTPLGFRQSGLLEAQLFPLPHGYDSTDLPSYYRELLGKVSAIPGTESVAISNFAPLFASGYSQLITLTNEPRGRGIRSEIFWTSHGFLKTMQIPLLKGRDFDASDTPSSVRTAIVSESLARRLRHDWDIVGKYIRVGDQLSDQNVLVVGIAADTKLNDPKADETPLVYLNYWQDPSAEGYPVIVARARSLDAAFVSTLRREIQSAGHEYVEYARTLEEQHANALLSDRLTAWLSTAFGALTLSLAGIGLYGLLALSVEHRRNEIGVRMALGADRQRIRKLIGREALILIASGSAIGLPLAAAALRTVRGLVYGVSATDTTGVFVAILLLLLAAVIASWAPVSRACSVDPMNVLKSE